VSQTLPKRRERGLPARREKERSPDQKVGQEDPRQEEAVRLEIQKESGSVSANLVPPVGMAVEASEEIVGIAVDLAVFVIHLGLSVLVTGAQAAERRGRPL